MQILRAKNILITGCNRGIGMSMLQVCASHGANVWANARQYNADFENYCFEMSKKYCVNVTPVYFDLASKQEILSAVKSIKNSEYPINGLINNAGITHNALFQMSTEANIRENLDVNFVGPFILTQYITKLMVRNGGGAIVSIASSAAFDANAGRAAYGASKAALLTATKALSRELGGAKVRANTIAPGITQTDMLASMSEETIKQTGESTALGRCGRPDEIASVAAFLISDLSSYITGQTLRVDGGM